MKRLALTLAAASFAAAAQGQTGQPPRAVEIPAAPQLSRPADPRRPPPATPETRPAVPSGDGKTIFTPEAIALGTPIQATVATPNGQHFFRMPSASPLKRDWVAVKLENRSVTLRPCITVFDADRNKVADPQCNGNPSANLNWRFLARPNAVYIVQVGGWDTAGDYTLVVAPENAYDTLEPNDGFVDARELPLGKAVTDLNIMDAADVDFYKITAGAGAMAITVALENLSMTLRPCITVFDADRNRMGDSQCNGNPAANITARRDVKPGVTYFVEISGWDSSGKYALTVK